MDVISFVEKDLNFMGGEKLLTPWSKYLYVGGLGSLSFSFPLLVVKSIIEEKYLLKASPILCWFLKCYSPMIISRIS